MFRPIQDDHDWSKRVGVMTNCVYKNIILTPVHLLVLQCDIIFIRQTN
jgi:hypothetical protein